jgi:hypothetical protein
MTTVSSSIIINHTIKDIFDYIVNPKNGPKYNSYLNETLNFQPIEPCLGQTFDWRYSMSGIKMEGSAKVVEFVPTQKYVISSTGDILSTWTYLFKEELEGVRVTISIAYEFDQNFIQKIVNQFVLSLHNQKAIEDSLENLKAQLET